MDMFERFGITKGQQCLLLDKASKAQAVFSHEAFNPQSTYPVMCPPYNPTETITKEHLRSNNSIVLIGSIIRLSFDPVTKTTLLIITSHEDTKRSIVETIASQSETLKAYLTNFIQADMKSQGVSIGTQEVGFSNYEGESTPPPFQKDS